MLSKPVAQRCRLNENFGIDESFRWPVLAEGAVSDAIRRECIARMPTLFRGLLSRIEDFFPSFKGGRLMVLAQDNSIIFEV